MMNLIALARTDGNFHDKELEILYRIGNKYELKTKHIDALLSSREKLHENISGDHGQCMEQVYDLVEMMLADGVIAEKEVGFCENMLHSMGYKSSLLNKFIDYVKLGLKDYESWEFFKQEAKLYKNALT